MDAGAVGYAPQVETSITPAPEIRHDPAADFGTRVANFLKPASSPVYDIPVVGGALRSLIEGTAGKASQFGAEAINRAFKVGAGALTAGGETLLEKFGGGQGSFRSSMRPAANPVDWLGAAGDVAHEQGQTTETGLRLKSDLGEHDVTVEDLFGLQSALLPLPAAKAASVRRVVAPVQRALPAPRRAGPARGPLALPPGPQVMRGAVAMPSSRGRFSSARGSDVQAPYRPTGGSVVDSIPAAAKNVEPSISLAELKSRIIAARGSREVPRGKNVNVRNDLEQQAAQAGVETPMQRAFADRLKTYVAAKEEPAAPRGLLAESGMSGPLVGRAIGRGGSQVSRVRDVAPLDATPNDVHASLVRQTKVHDANEAAIAAMRDIVNAPKGSEDYAALERAIRDVSLLGGDLNHTAQRMRAAGLPAPTAGDVRLMARPDTSFESTHIEGEQRGAMYVGAKEVQGLRPGEWDSVSRRVAPSVFKSVEDTGLVIDHSEVMQGGWRSGTERSLELRVRGDVEHMQYAAARAGKDHNQEAVLVIDGPGETPVTEIYLPFTPESQELFSAMQEFAPEGFSVRYSGSATKEGGVITGLPGGEIAGDPYQIEIAHLRQPSQDIAAYLDLLFERLESVGIEPGEHSVSYRTAFLVEAKDYDRVIASYSGDRSSGVRGRGEDVSRGTPGARRTIPVEGEGIGGAGGTRTDRGAAGPLTPDRAERLLLKVAKETSPEQYAREMGRAWLTASGRLVRVGGVYHDTLLNRAGISWRDTARARLVRLNNENVEVSFEVGTSPGVSEAQSDTLAAIREASGRRLNVEATEIGPGPATTAPFDIREGGFAPRQIAGGSGASDRALTRADLERIRAERKRGHENTDESFDRMVGPTAAPTTSAPRTTNMRPDAPLPSGEIPGKPSRNPLKMLDVADALNIPRTLMTTGEISYSFRQGLVLGLGHPIKMAQAMAKQVLAFRSEKRAAEYSQKIAADPAYQTLRDLGLELTDWTGKLGPMEEGFLSRTLAHAPVVRWANRAGVTYLNSLRFSVAKDALRAAEIVNPTVMTPKRVTQLRGLMQFINAASGRGKLPNIPRAGKSPIQLEDYADALNGIFFSPRLIMSRLEVAAALPKAAITRNPLLAKEAARDIAAVMVAGYGIMQLAQMNGAKVVDDPTSTDWGKIQVGNTRIDIWGGFQQYARFAAQMIAGKSTTLAGNERKWDNSGAFPTNRASEAIRFARGKLAPVPAAAWNALAGENIVGQETTLWSTIGGLITPLSYQDIYEAIVDDLRNTGDWKRGAAAGALGMIGVGAQTIPDDGDIPSIPEALFGALSGGRQFLDPVATPTPKPTKTPAPTKTPKPSTPRPSATPRRSAAPSATYTPFSTPRP